MSETYGQRLKAARCARGMSLRAAGKLAGLSPTYVQNLERDEANPTIAVAARVAAEFGVLPGIVTEYVEAYGDGERSGWLRGYAEAQRYVVEVLNGQRALCDIPGPTGALAAWCAARDTTATATGDSGGEG